MTAAYIVQENSETSAMARVRCANEEEELQLLLENNPDLLPGDQIDPENPRRWLLVKREMPVQDPGTGGDRWSVDHFFVDQNGVPTFVECKRLSDTRSRREVVAQMIDYAANGHYYWTKEMIRQYASMTATEKGRTLEETLLALQPDFEADVEAFVEVVENNLREGQLRLVFFLEEAPRELKSMVEFLNNQMERTEVLIVEAQQFEKNGVRVVVPSLFGYQEEARLIKKAVTVSSGGRRTWNAESFFEDAENRLSGEAVQRLRSVYKFLAQNDEFLLKWGTGKVRGGINVSLPAINSKAVISIGSDGKVWVNFGAFSSNEAEKAIQMRMASWVSSIGLAVPDDMDRRYPSYPIEAFGVDPADSVARLARSLASSN